MAEESRKLCPRQRLNTIHTCHLGGSQNLQTSVKTERSENIQIYGMLTNGTQKNNFTVTIMWDMLTPKWQLQMITKSICVQNNVESVDFQPN